MHCDPESYNECLVVQGFTCLNEPLDYVLVLAQVPDNFGTATSVKHPKPSLLDKDKMKEITQLLSLFALEIQSGSVQICQSGSLYFFLSCHKFVLQYTVIPISRK